MKKVDIWRQRIADRSTSGLTVKEWCIQNEVSIGQYYYWFRRMRLLEEREDRNEAIFAEITKDTSLPLQESSCACGNLLVSWNGLSNAGYQFRRCKVGC